MTDEALENKSLLSISEASSLLGVSEATLRQWTDEGKIKAFVTPGGHRRYQRNELKEFVVSHQKMLGIKDLVAELEETVALHRELSRSYVKSAHWFETLDSKSQVLVIDLGRQLHHLILLYVTEASHREHILTQASEVGRQFGETLAKFGLPLADSVEAFLLHREPILKATMQLVKKKETLSDRVVETIPLVANVIDKALVSLMLAHQQFSATSTKSGGGAIS
ncbi:MAG: helix-turn-helix domain-containing protein [Chloroflexi bacterium]|nr:helix-turn-helix domain-containing protein [Chloroflexota bacterium]